MIVATPREALWGWLNTRIGTPWSSDFRAIGLVKDDCLLAVAGYNTWAGRSCCMHIAIDEPKWVSRTFVRAIFEYPFVQRGVVQLLAPVSSTNVSSVSLIKHVGFKEFCQLEGAGSEGEDLLFFKMRPNECRWIKERTNGKVLSTGST